MPPLIPRSQLWDILKSIGANISNDDDLYFAIDALSQTSAKNLKPVIELLIKAGAKLPGEKELFLSCIQLKADHIKIQITSNELNNASLKANTHPSVYHAIFQQTQFDEKLASHFISLNQYISENMHGSLQDYPEFIYLMAEASNNAVWLKEICKVLLSCNFTSKARISILNCIKEKSKNKKDIAYLDQVNILLSILKKFNLTQDKNLTCFNELLFDRAIKAHNLFSSLRAAGFDVVHYQFLFEYLLEKLSDKHYHLIELEQIAHQLIEYAHYHLLEESTQYIKDYLNQLNNTKVIQYGPLRKNKTTTAFEALLKRLFQTRLDKISIEFKQPQGYILCIDKDCYHLSALLRNVNLSQMVLSTAEVAKVSLLLHRLSTIFQNILYPEDKVLNSLSTAEQKALNIYVGAKIYNDEYFNYYKNINRFFRGEPLIDSDEVLVNGNCHSTENYLSCLLVGVLLNHACNQFSYLIDQLEEKQLLDKLISEKALVLSKVQNDHQAFEEALEQCLYKDLITKNEKNKLSQCFKDLKKFYPSHLFLKRGEKNLTDRHILKRTSRTWSTPSITSFSMLDGGCNNFLSQDTHSSTVKADCFPNNIIINEDEGEVILAQGEQLRCAYNKKNLEFYLEVLRSPDLVKEDNYWVETAIGEAAFYYNRPYHDQSDRQEFYNNDGTVVSIERPVHGLPHHYHLLAMIDVVIHYYAKHAKEDAFRKFCQTISTEAQKWLQIAAAFSRTGRESEISHSDNPKKYQGYLWASAENFKKFINHSPLEFDNETMSECLIFVLRHMGHPNFEHLLSEEEKAHPPSSDHRMLRNYLHRILLTAHNSDLIRIYKANKFKQAMASCRELSIHSENHPDYIEMLRYAERLIKARGDRTCCHIRRDGQIVDVDIPYNEPLFIETNHSIKALIDVCDAVPKPLKQENTRLHGKEGSYKKFMQSLNAQGIKITNINQLNKPNHFANTPLTIAAFEGKEEAIDLLLTVPSVIKNINHQGQFGGTALYWAAYNGHQQVVQKLLVAGADKNIANRFAELPRIEAISVNAPEHIQLYDKSPIILESINKNEFLTFNKTPFHPRMRHGAKYITISNFLSLRAIDELSLRELMQLDIEMEAIGESLLFYNDIRAAIKHHALNYLYMKNEVDSFTNIKIKTTHACHLAKLFPDRKQDILAILFQNRVWTDVLDNKKDFELFLQSFSAEKEQILSYLFAEQDKLKQILASYKDVYHLIAAFPEQKNTIYKFLNSQEPILLKIIKADGEMAIFLNQLQFNKAWIFYILIFDSEWMKKNIRTTQNIIDMASCFPEQKEALYDYIKYQKPLVKDIYSSGLNIHLFLSQFAHCKDIVFETISQRPDLKKRLFFKIVSLKLLTESFPEQKAYFFKEVFKENKMLCDKLLEDAESLQIFVSTFPTQKERIFNRLIANKSWLKKVIHNGSSAISFKESFPDYQDEIFECIYQDKAWFRQIMRYEETLEPLKKAFPKHKQKINQYEKPNYFFFKGKHQNESPSSSDNPDYNWY
jgi:hypothetical protein